MKAFLFWCLWVFPLLGEAATVLNGHAYDYKKPWAYTFDKGDALWLGYYSTDGHLYLRTPQGEEKALTAPQERRTGSGIALSIRGDDVYALWRKKFRRKTLILSVSHDGGKTFASKVIDEMSEPLTRFRMASTPKALYLLWLGERTMKREFRSPEYNLYFTYSKDGGKTFADAVRVLQGIYPAWIVDDKGVSVFSWSNLNGKLVMAMRRFDIDKESFGKAVEITPAPQITPIFDAFASGDRWFLMWHGQYGPNLDEYLLEGAYSDDRGKTWKRFSLDATRGMDISRMDVCGDGRHLFVVYSGRRNLPGETKENVYLLRSGDNGSTWEGPVLLRHYPYLNTKARYPSIACNDQGEVLVAWEDWRDIRANVYLNYSKDYGDTWQKQDTPLEAGKVNVGLDPFVDALAFHNGRYYLFAERYHSDELRDRDLVLYPVSLHALSQPSKEKSPHYTEKRLKERIDAFWRALEKDDFATAFLFYDPFFRARNRVEGFMTAKGRIKYYSHNVKEVKIEGKVAKAKVEVEYSVPKFRLGDKTFSRPKTRTLFKTTWVFVDGDWFKEYYSEARNLRFTQY